LRGRRNRCQIRPSKGRRQRREQSDIKGSDGFGPDLIRRQFGLRAHQGSAIGSA